MLVVHYGFYEHSCYTNYIGTGTAAPRAVSGSLTPPLVPIKYVLHSRCTFKAQVVSLIRPCNYVLLELMRVPLCNLRNGWNPTQKKEREGTSTMDCTHGAVG